MAPYGRRSPSWQLSGYDLCTLMRRHRVTIRMLAQRLALPMTRVRYRRRHGIEEWNVIRDWVQAITGADPGAVPHAVSQNTPAATPPP
jgi:hypothetical protein